MNNEKELDINIIEIIRIIYNKKWKVITITILSLFIGISYSIYSKPKFETDIEYKKNESFDLSLTEIDSLLYNSLNSLDIFSNWKKTSDYKILKFEEITNSININSLEFKRDIGQNLIEFNSNKEYRSIILKTNQIDLIKNIYSYLEFINSFITKTYSEELLTNFTIGSDLFKEEKINYNNIDHELFKIKKSISKIKNGELLIEFKPPTESKLVSTPTISILFISVIIGFLFSIFFIFFSDFIKKIKLELNKNKYF